MHKGKARALLQALRPSTNHPDPEQFDRVGDAVRAIGSDRFQDFALTRVDVLRRRMEQLLAQRAYRIEELVAAGREISAEEAGIRKISPPARVQLMTIDSCKGREFDLVVLVNHPHEPFLRRDDAPDYSAARAKLYTAITRARHAVAVVAPEDDACELLEPLG
jgi:superfamily I DNA/RNA helicase